MGLSVLMSVIRANNNPKETAAEANNKKINRMILCKPGPAIS